MEQQERSPQAQRIALIGGLVVLAGALAAVVIGLRVESPPPPPAPRSAPAPAPSTAKTPPRTHLPRPAAAPAPAGHSAIDRLEADAGTLAGPATQAPPPPDTGAAEDAPPVDRRPDAKGDSSQLLADIKAGMDTARDDIGACIEQWAEVEPGIDGQVMVGFSIGPEGLQDAWIIDHADVPPGPLTCFASAVWEVDWADITEEPLEVSFPFRVTTDDAE